MRLHRRSTLSMVSPPVHRTPQITTPQSNHRPPLTPFWHCLQTSPPRPPTTHLNPTGSFFARHRRETQTSETTASSTISSPRLHSRSSPAPILSQPYVSSPGASAGGSSPSNLCIPTITPRHASGHCDILLSTSTPADRLSLIATAAFALPISQVGTSAMVG